MSDYTYWQARLAGKPTDGLPIPGYGFYRLPGRKVKTERKTLKEAAKFVFSEDRPVALYGTQDGRYIVKVGASAPSVEDPDEVKKSLFPMICSYPIEHAVYSAVTSGEPWPERVVGIGHNAPPEGFEALQIEVDRLTDRAAEILKLPVEDEKQATQAGRASKALAGLAKELKRLRDQEKKPHDEASTAVQRKFTPSIAKAICAARDLKNHMETFLLLKQRRLREEQEQRERAEREARETLGIDDAAPAPTAPRKASIATGGVGLTNRKVVVIDDLPKAAAFIAAMNNPPQDFVDVVRQISWKILAAGVDVPGAHFDTVTTAR